MTTEPEITEDGDGFAVSFRLPGPADIDEIDEARDAVRDWIVDLISWYDGRYAPTTEPVDYPVWPQRRTIIDVMLPEDVD